MARPVSPENFVLLDYLVGFFVPPRLQPAPRDARLPEPARTMLLRAVTFEITGVLVCMSVPLGQVYGDALRHYRLPCPDDGAMKSAFKRAYGGVGAELPNFGAGESPPMPERVWWNKMIRATLNEVSGR